MAAHHVSERCNALASATESATESIASVPNVARSLEGFQASNSRPSDDTAARQVWTSVPTSVIHASAIAYVEGGDHRPANPAGSELALAAAASYRLRPARPDPRESHVDRAMPR